MKIALVGYGTMGQIVHSEMTDDDVVGIVSPGYLDHVNEFQDVPDCIIDFSHPNNLEQICEYASKHKVPVVFATTGFTDDDVEKIVALSEEVPVLYTANFSFGITVMNRIIREITPIMKDSFDIEVIEKHHNKKIDAPSGTAKMLMSSINVSKDYDFVYGREGSSKRQTNEVGVHSLRGGTIFGEHSVIYAGTDEVIEIKHEAHSKKIFAKGALVGAKWLAKKPIGLYNMENVLFE